MSSDGVKRIGNWVEDTSTSKIIRRFMRRIGLAKVLVDFHKGRHGFDPIYRWRRISKLIRSDVR